MKNSCLGIIAEYNPFHNGHKYHINEAKRISLAEHVIVCLSASFVQRGEPACADKFTRTRWALEGGADMVIELPDLLSVSCAERFAFGGIKLLNSTGLISSICFGSESGDIEMLRHIANIELNQVLLKDALAHGLSYPVARSKAFAENGINIPDSKPNDLLGIEYIRAINTLAPKLNIFAIKRIGNDYNDISGNSRFASATAIRRLINDPASISNIKALPEFVLKTIHTQIHLGKMPATLEALSAPIIYSLRKLGISGISQLAEVSEGLEKRLFVAAQTNSTYDELLYAVKTKRYTMARLKRILINSLLNTTAKLQDNAINSTDALYIRVLGIRRDSIHLLSKLHKSSSLPVITRHSDLSRLPDEALKTFNHTSFASSVRTLAQPGLKACRDEFSSALIIV